MANEIVEFNKMTPAYGDVNQGTVAIESSRAITEAQRIKWYSNLQTCNYPLCIFCRK